MCFSRFSAEDISSDGALILLEKLEKKHKLMSHFSGYIPDQRNPSKAIHSIEKLLKQRVFMLGYEDTNDISHLKNDPLYRDILDGELASLKGRDHIIIDIDSTDDPTYGMYISLKMCHPYHSNLVLRHI